MSAPPLPFASASTSITSPRCATRAAGGIPIRSTPPRSRSPPAPTASPRICARIAGIFVDDDMARLKAASTSRSTSRWRRRRRWWRSRAVRPHAACLVPERRAERTTEGGLDVAGQHDTLRAGVARLTEAGIRVSLFIAADPPDRGRGAVGAPVIEIHTGAWCDALAAGDAAGAAAEFERIARGAALARRRSRSSCRSRTRFHHGGADRGACRNRRAQYRPFPDRRGDFGGLAAAVSECAPRWTGPGRIKGRR